MRGLVKSWLPSYSPLQFRYVLPTFQFSLLCDSPKPNMFRNIAHHAHCSSLRLYTTIHPKSAPSTGIPYELTDQTVPRYLRRKLLSGTKKTPDPLGKDPSPSFRSKHLDPAQPRKEKSEIRLLEPHTLSARLKKLCDANKIDDAVTMLKNAPLDAQNTPVWNTLIWECMKARRFKLGYQLFIDVKGVPSFHNQPYSVIFFR